MAAGMIPIRRVVTGNDERSQSNVMRKTRALDFCIVLEGEIVLVLDTQEVALKVGDFVVQRGTNHAWSNRSNNPAVLAIASHDGA